MRRASVALVGSAAALTVWLCAVCAAASAAKVPTVATITKTATADDQTLVAAKCPTGRFPVSGGYELEPSDGAFAINSAEGIDLDRKRWSLTTIAGGGPARVTSLAYCSPLARNVKFRSDRIELSTADSATITATCKRDEKVLSGGYAFVSSGLGVGEIQESFRADSRSWSIKGFNVSANQVLMLAFANCVAKQKAPKLTTEQNAVRFNDEGDTTASVDCGRGRYALSGGFRIPDPAGLVPESMRDGTSGWRVTAGGISGRDDDLTVLAYCARR